MIHNFRRPWSKTSGLRSEFAKPIASPLKELQNLAFMGHISNHTYSDTPILPPLPLHETSDKYQSLTPVFKPITITCTDSMKFSPLISLDLNQSSEHLDSTGSTGFYTSNSGPPNSCVIEKIIPETNGHDSDKSNSICVSFDSDVDEEIKFDDDTSFDSCVSTSNVVSKSTLVLINLHFNNPSVARTSKSSSDS